MKQKLNNFKVVLKYFSEYKYKLIIYSIILFLANMSFVFTGYLVGNATELVTNGKVYEAVISLLIFFAICIVSNGTIYVVYYLFNKLQTIISRKIGMDVYDKTLRLPARAFEDMSSGQIVNRVTSDSENLVGLSQRIIEMIARIVSALLILVYIFMNSYIVGFEIIAFLFIYYFIVKNYTKKLKDLKEITKKENDKFTSLTTESIRGIREIKTLGIVNILSEKMNNIVSKLTKVSINETKASTEYDIVSGSMCSVLESSTFITCAVLVGFGKCSLTFFIGMTYYVYRYTWIIESLTNFTKDLSKMMVSFNRIADIINNKLYEDVKFGDVKLNNPKGIIEFKNVTFNYPNESAVLKEFSVKFEPNKKIAIVGASGGGKTTLFNLLTRIFDTENGEVLVDNINIKDLDEKSLRNNISIIRQDPFIFNLSIKDNFKILDESITLKEIR